MQMGLLVFIYECGNILDIISYFMQVMVLISSWDTQQYHFAQGVMVPFIIIIFVKPMELFLQLL